MVIEQSISEKINPEQKCMIYFALSPDFADVVSNSDLPVRIFNNYLEYARIRPDTFCFVIGTKNVNKASKILKNLRADLHSSVKPLFLLRFLGETVDRLSDGIVHTLEEAFERSEAMIYVSNPTRVAQLAGPIAKRYPIIKFYIAQSVESILTKKESYFTKTKKEFRAKMTQLHSEMEHDNFSTIFVQSWEDLERMLP